MQVKEALRTLHPDTCFLNHEDHEENQERTHEEGCCKLSTVNCKLIF